MKRDRRWFVGARAVCGIALGRIAVDPIGRAGLLLTGLVAAFGCTLLGTALLGARRDMMVIITQRVFGLSAVPLKWGDGRRMSAADVSRLLQYHAIAITCSRPSHAVMPTGELIPIRRVVGSPAGLARLGSVLSSGRTLGPADTMGVAPGAIIGEQLAGFWERGARIAGPDPSTKVVGVLAAPQESPTSLTLMTLLRARDVATACGDDALIDVGISGPISTAKARAARIAWMVQDRQRPAAALPEQLRLVPILPMQLVRKVSDAEHTTAAVLSAAMAVFAAAGVATIVVLVVVRAEGRRADIGVARAVGAPRGTIIAEFVAESAMIGVAAGGGGALTAWVGLAVVLRATTFGRPSVWVALAAFAAVVTAFELAAWWTAWGVTRQQPHDLFAGERW